MKITVAALMTTTWIARFLEPPDAVTKIMIPGLCEGETDVLAERFGIPAEKGPADLKRLPSWFGQADARESYGRRDIRVFAEINHVPRLSRERILEIAGYYRDAGADFIDLGLSLERRWLDEGPGGDRRAARTRLRPEHRHDGPRRDPDGRRGGRRLCAQPQRVQPRPRRAPARDARAHPRHAGGPRQPRGDDRPPREARQALSRRPDHRADRHRLRGQSRALPRGPPAPSRGGDAHGDRQPHRADRGRQHGGDRDADRLLPGARHPQRAHHRGHRVGARRRPGGGARGAAHALRAGAGHAARSTSTGGC